MHTSNFYIAPTPKPASPASSSKGEIYHDDSDVEDDEVKDEEEEEEVDLLTRILGKTKRKELPLVDHSKVSYSPFIKDLYREVADIGKMTEDEVKAYREKDLQGVKIKGKNCPRPIKMWVQCGLNDKLLKALEKHKYVAPTPIQAQAIPAIMSGRDIIGIAKTGSGKTLSFLLPMLRHILAQQPLSEGEGPIGLIMAPTRELALQIYEESRKFAKVLGINVACIYGGASMSEQIAELRRGSSIVVCTPGRMIDMLCANHGRVVNLQRVTFVVLDEADRMFDLGFEPQIMRIVDNVRPDRQTIMFSATFPRSVELAARRILSQPLEIVIGGRSIVASEIDQHVEVRNEDSKFKRLLELVSEWYDKGSILIFVDRQDSCDKLFQQLMKANYPCLSLHGGMDQNDRDSTISDFKDHSRTIMVATSVAARGLDVKELNLVINFDAPTHYEDYVHRVGRTGRAGNKGTAYTFVTPDEDKVASEIVKALEIAKAPISEELKKLADEFEAKRKEGKAQGGGGFGGKGFRFDENELNKRADQIKAQKAAFGVDDDDDKEKDTVIDDDEEEEEQVKPAPIPTKVTTTLPSGASLFKPLFPTPVMDPSLMPTIPQIAPTPVVSTPVSTISPLAGGAVFAALQALTPINATSTSTSTPSTSNGTTKPNFDTLLTQFQSQIHTHIQSKVQVQAQALAQTLPSVTTPTPSLNLAASSQVEQAQKKAAEFAAQFATRAGQTENKTKIVILNPTVQPAPAPIITPPAPAKRYSDELEINDYPQAARFKVTNGYTLDMIHEYTGVGVTARGTYIGPGVPLGSNRKLYLYLEGSTESAVKKAKEEILKILKEASLSAPSDKRTGRYSVL